MRSLLDVNVLLALFDSGHIFHQRARDWLDSVIDDGWASCPITQAGFVRIISGTGYAAPIGTAQAVQLLGGATADPHHRFWPDDIALTGPQIDRTRLLSHNQVTDVYLLALAVAHGGRFVTFDQRISPAAVPGATPAHLLVLH